MSKLACFSCREIESIGLTESKYSEKAAFVIFLVVVVVLSCGFTNTQSQGHSAAIQNIEGAAEEAAIADEPLCIVLQPTCINQSPNLHYVTAKAFILQAGYYHLFCNI